MLYDNEQIERIVNDAGGVARTADFNKAGYNNVMVSDICRQGMIERIRSGYYSLPQNEPREEEIIAKLFPDCIVCQDSALFYYGYIDKVPLVWNLAAPRSVTRSRFEISYPPVRFNMVHQNIFELGRTIGVWNGVKLAVYDRERTICDCFRHRAQMDSEMFSKAVNAYAVDEKKNLANLSKYAKQMRVNKKVAEIMEVLLYG